jgi:predicted outer membrane repeat protein
MFAKNALVAPVAAAVTAATLAVSASADSVLVDWTGAGDYTTISAGIAAADSSDTVWVAPGTYTGAANRELDFDDKDIVLMSTEGRDVTVIDAEGQGRAFNLITETTPVTLISGFTIRNGYAENGGGMWLGSHAFPTIMQCRIENCEATAASGGGGGMACEVGSPTLVDVVFSGNRGRYGGGLFAVLNSLPTLTRVTFEGNEGESGGGGIYYDGSHSLEEITLTDCTFYSNSCPGSYGGGGLYVERASPTFTGCTFAWNSTYSNGTSMYLHVSSPTIENSILSFGHGGSALYPPSEGATIARCIVYGNENGDWLPGAVSDTLNRDPRFCGVLSGDLALCDNSWALPENNDWTVLMGAHGEGCGPCLTPVEGSSWGKLKALYR